MSPPGGRNRLPGRKTCRKAADARLEEIYRPTEALCALTKEPYANQFN
jgi:hypothetical protein